MRNIWGRFFPGFSEKEDRRYDFSQMEKWIEKVELLTLEAIHFFKFKSVLSLEELLSMAENKHYSTFSLYSEAELDKALKSFKQNIKNNFADTERVQWTDENVMIFFIKEQSILYMVQNRCFIWKCMILYICNERTLSQLRIMIL